MSSRGAALALSVVGSSLAAALVGVPGASAQGPPRLTAVESFTAPIYVTAPPGDGRRLLVVERQGAIRVVRDGQKLAQPFLDISADVDTTGEGGLLSMAFPSDYRQSGYFYVFLTPRDGDPGAAPHAPIQVREYRRSAADPDRAEPASARGVLTVPHPDNANHYGGQLQFGPDGLLYVSTGDGGGRGDPPRNAQSTETRLGKLLRLSPRPSDGAPFGVPASNPFVGRAGDDLVFSYGLRNPFRFSFDRANGDLTIGDVGQNRAEEIDFVPAGQGSGRGSNFGWNACEGPFAYPIVGGGEPCSLPGRTDPVHHYLSEGTSCSTSITGGVVVRDPGLEALTGRYVYGDFCKGFVHQIQLATPTASGDSDLGLGVAPFSLVAFGEDACGRVHMVQLSGAVSRLEDDSPAPCPPRADPYPAPLDPGGAPAGGAPAGGAPGGGATAPVDLRLASPRRQRALRRRAVVVRVQCDRACGVRALGRLSLRRRGAALRLRPAARRLRAERWETIRLALPRRARVALRRALGRGRRVDAKLTVRARGLDGGELRVKRRTVRLIR